MDGVTTEYFLQGSTILAEKTGNNVIWYIYDTGGELLGFTYNGTPYYYLKNMQGDVYKIVDATGTVVGSYTYDPWGKIIDDDDGPMVDINPIRYRSYYYDNETQLYYLQSRYYDPELGRFINADVYTSTGQGFVGNNMFAYCLNNPVNHSDPGGRRTYILNGINNNSPSGIPGYSVTLQEELTKAGTSDVRTIGIYEGQYGILGTVTGVSEVGLEMINIDVYSSEIVKFIEEDLKNNPLAAGEELNLIGYSGGGQIACNVSEKMKGKITNVILIGAPVLEMELTTTKYSVLYAGWDILSWNIGVGCKSYFAGWYGHWGYFKPKNIDKTVDIITGIIK